jgi:Na+/proline symporter
MNLKLIVGMGLFCLGIIAAVVGIGGIGEVTGQPGLVTDRNAGASVLEGARDFVLPAVAGLLLAVGALLMGLSLGNWRHPRTQLKPGDEVVNPEGYHKMKHV